MPVAIKMLFWEEKGQGMTEYSLIIGLVAVLLIGGLVAMREKLANFLGWIVSVMP